MAFINHFAEAEDEQNYLQSERASRLKATRAVIILGPLIFLGFFMLTPVFSSNEAFATFNITTMVIVGFFALAIFATTTRHYLEWPWLDLLPFICMSIAAAALMTVLVGTTTADDLDITKISVVFFGLIYFIASAAFVANVRLFMIWAIGTLGIFIVYMDTHGIDIDEMYHTIVNISFFLLFAIFANWEADRRARAMYVARQELNQERKKTEKLLYNVLPQAVAKRLRAGEVVADSFSDISVVFIDIVGFSKLSKQLTPGHLVEQLNGFFLIADQCANRYGIEKVKTIGDCYLAVCGGTASDGPGAKDAVSFAKDVIAEMQTRAKESGIDIKLRVGVHSGPVVGGVVGTSRLAYDYWGDTMNIASRIEGAAEPNGIAVSAATYFQCTGSHEFGSPETIALKGVGDTIIYRLKPDVAE
jgi:adenylate cyclase